MGRHSNFKYLTNIVYIVPKHSPPPDNLESTATLIKWLNNNEYTKILGIPFWKQGDEDQYWTDLYIKIK
jgi:hypothetical protein